MDRLDVTRHGERSADVVVSDQGPGERLDRVLTDVFPDLSRSRIQKAIGAEEVTVDGEPVSKSYSVDGGETIRCRISGPDPIRAEPQPIPLDVVYEDEVLIVVDKPAGLVVHPAPGHPDGTLVNALLHHVGGSEVRVEEGTELEVEDDELGLSTVRAAPSGPSSRTVRPGIVHRLDKDTTGLLVVAKTDRVHTGLAAQFRAHTVDRQYQALVWGRPERTTGTIDAPIGRDPARRTRMAVTDRHGGKEAITRYRVQASRGPISLLAFQLETGRTHQIRVHAAHLGHPVLGDPTYGGRGVKYGPRHGPARRELEAIVEETSRQALHARVLGFTHPDTEEELRFVSDWPRDMLAVWQRLRSFDES